MLALFPFLSSQIQIASDNFAVRLAFHLYPYIMISGLGAGSTYTTASTNSVSLELFPSIP